MCGIVGIVNQRHRLDPAVLHSMRETLAHRGPDDAGAWISPDGCIALGHRRLSILDLSSAGHQPMSDENGEIWTTYNGEIYNFQTLRKELEQYGYRFRSATDTKVIVL